MGRLFGTDGVRGIAGSELSPLLAFRLGRAGALVLAKQVHKPRILVGTDTRLSCDMLESALMAGIVSTGAEAVRLGVLPTPAVAHLTRTQGASAGVVISASHNPAKYNGIKFFSSDGHKLPDKTEDEIQAIIEAEETPVFSSDTIGRIHTVAENIEAYISHAIGTVSTDFKGLRIAMDCANGATAAIAPEVFRRKGAVVTPLFCEPNGLNINDGCGSTHMEALSDFVKNGQFDIGIAFDGDGDRVLLTDENGNIIDGDRIMAVLAIAREKAGLLPSHTLVATVMSNLGLEIACRNHGINLVRTAVGDRYVLEEMQKGGYALGGEQSGHIICADHATTGDGIVSALQFIEIMQTTGKTASALASVMTPLPQVLRNVKIENHLKNTLTSKLEIAQEISRIENSLADKGRILIRPSGTEPQVRIMLEGEDLASIEKEAEILATLISDLAQKEK